MSWGSEHWSLGFDVKRYENHTEERFVKRGRSKRQKITTVLNEDRLEIEFWNHDVGEPWGPGPGFEVFIINSDNEIIETIKTYQCRNNYFSIDHDRLKKAGQKLSDVTYRVVMNVFQQNENGEEDSDEDSEEQSEEISDKDSDEDSDY